MKKVKGYNNLYRNDSGVIINTDDSAYLSYKKKRAALSRKDEQVKLLSEQLQEAKSEIEELKELVRQVLNK